MQIIPKRIIIILVLIEQYIYLNHLVEKSINLLFFFLFTVTEKKVWLFRWAVQVERWLAAFTKSSLLYVPYYS